MNDRFVLITGTSRGIGRATALRLASAGVSVIAGVRTPEDGAQLEREAHGRLTSAILDIGRDESSRRCVTPTCAAPNPSEFPHEALNAQAWDPPRLQAQSRSPRESREEITFSLDEVHQGAVALRLTTGSVSGARRYCVQFGGTVGRDEPGVFDAKDTPSPVTCPFP